MSIFQKSVMKNYLSGIDSDQLENAYQIFQKNYSPGKIEKIKTLKEEEYQDGFLRDIFVNVLGYTLKPDDHFNLVREFKNQSDGKKADGAILNNGNAKAVIELKSTKTKDLKTITAQAFNYKNNQPECHYVITSNFQKLRFYIDYAHEYEEFDLFRLNRKDFELMFLILCKESILNDTPEKLKKESASHEERVSKQLYADYSVFRNTLFENITKNNPTIDQLTLFRKTQTLIDRFLFILFAEDKRLLPPNSVNRIIERFHTLKEEDAYKPLYEIYTQYFDYMNIGRKGKRTIDDIPAYNGGLFYPDEILHTLKIDDDILIHDLQTLSVYDFDTEVDVNILGHIFEHSLSEIEEITARITGTDVDKSKSKRKKDGIFYTPQYITQYIVENTVGRLCEEKRHELDIKEIEFDDSYYSKKGNLSKKGKILYQKLEEYKKWLLSLKILDPACGSGAFLNQALTFLIREHNFIIDVQTDVKKGQVSMFNVEKAVLENNLYGVDINEESVEITKLSLWLRTAHRKRKLSNLNSNLRCGNSLIDDPEIAGDKAFKWEKEFSEIMENGGFDVVIGNPPYVPTEYIRENDKKFLEKTYCSAFGRINLYPIFFEKGISILKEMGKLGLITPYTILKNQYYKEARRVILEQTSIITLIDFKGVPVFEDAAVDSIVLILHKDTGLNNEYNQIYNIKDFLTANYDTLTINQSEILKNEDLSLVISTNDTSFKKVGTDCIQVKDILNFKQGIITGNNKAFLTNVTSSLTKKVLTGSDFNKYYLKKSSQYIIYDTEKLHRPRIPEIFELDQKILLRQTGSYPICTIDTEKHYTLDTVHNGNLINKNYGLKYILSLLNSKLLRFLYDNQINETGKVFAQVKIIYINPLPIKIANDIEQQPFIEKANIMLSKNKELHELKNGFLNFLTSELTPQKITKKLENWNALDWEQFKKEMTKCKIKALSLKERKEWQDYFIEQQEKADKLQSVIDSTDKEIDRMVYELYGLTQEEIEIIEA